jgi:hypothetical protein
MCIYVCVCGVGQALASVLSSRLRGRAVWCVSSPMVRALRTIEPTAQALGITQDRQVHTTTHISGHMYRQTNASLSLCYCGIAPSLSLGVCDVSVVCRWWVQCGSYEVGGCYLGDKAFPAQSHAHITQAFPVR